MHMVVVVLAVVVGIAAAAAETAGRNIVPLDCPTSCGDVSVPYPFGIGPGCSLPGFSLACDRTHTPPKLLLGNGTFLVTSISLPDATVRVLGTSIPITYHRNSSDGNGTWGGGLGDGSPFILSHQHNEFIFSGCNVEATLVGNGTNIVSCTAFCSRTRYTFDPDLFAMICSGSMGCCKVPILQGRSSYEMRLKRVGCEYDAQGPVTAFIAEKRWLRNSTMTLTGVGPLMVFLKPGSGVPAVLEWAIWSSPPPVPPGTGGVIHSNSTSTREAAGSLCRSSNSYRFDVNSFRRVRSGYVCKCQDGYHGNPYLIDGCHDVNECELPNKCYGSCTNIPGGYLCQCPRGTHGDPYKINGCVKSSAGLSIGLGAGGGAGLIILVLGVTFLNRKVKAQRKKKLRQRFFKQNRGQLLLQMVSQRADIAERMIITLEELEKATNNFDRAREFGSGGHGTVYKGILSSLHVVAIKKSKIVIQREIDDFINEVAILSQISHRNIVKLLGCCLETEVPLLVYEFISNGTLYDHLHVIDQKSLSWDKRLRIAVETARALAYLHSFVSTPIIHRDIKSPNILLDDNLTVKLSDFGASRYIPIDQTGVDTVVQGTFGYLDPMYYSTGHLTEKSDVYSFGVILIELLTKKKPVSYRSSQGYGLVKHFVSLLSEGNLVHILDPQVAEEGDGEVHDVALLAALCVGLRGEDRPTMRQVEMTLESIQASKEHAVSSDATDDRFEGTCAWVNDLSVEGADMERTAHAGWRYGLEQESLLSASRCGKKAR